MNGPGSRILTMKQLIYRFKRTGLVCFIRGLSFDGTTVRKAEPEVYEFMHANISSGWRCIDCGANRGEYSFLMANLVGPSGFVHAFELHPENAKQVKYNTWRFRDRIKIENVAVTDGEKGVVPVFTGKSQTSGTEWNIIGPRDGDAAGRPEFSIPAVSLDQYFSEKIDLVKIDVEGAGYEVVSGMQRMLRQACPVVVFEVHSPKEWESRKYFLDANYTIFTMQGQPMKAAKPFIFHCVAVPNGKSVNWPAP